MPWNVVLTNLSRGEVQNFRSATELRNADVVEKITSDHEDLQAVRQFFDEVLPDADWFIEQDGMGHVRITLRFNRG